MTRYKVLAIAYNRKTSKLIKSRNYLHSKSKRRRSEIIDISKNSLFKNCKTKQDIKKKYESFWNDLNPNSEEIVKVKGIIKL